MTLEDDWMKLFCLQIGSLIFFVPPEVSHLPLDRVRIDGERAEVLLDRAHSPKVPRPPSSMER